MRSMIGADDEQLEHVLPAAGEGNTEVTGEICFGTCLRLLD
jgi:hypothetical protein